jgi:copper(I)-binding protein
MRNRMPNLSIAAHAIAIAAMLMLVVASEARAGAITVTGAWIRALPPSVPSGGYFTLRNGSSKTVTLTGAESPACGMLMLHKSENHGGMGGMTMMDTVDVAPGGTVSFEPGGYHLMCLDSKPILKRGGKVPVMLQFAGGASVTAQFDVRTATGR